MTFPPERSLPKPLQTALLAFVAIHTSEQAEQAAALARSIWQEHYSPIIGPEQVGYMVDRFQSPGAILAQIQTGLDYFLVEQGGTPVGYLAVREEPDSTLFLSKIYLQASQRGQGLGREMWLFVLEIARQRGLLRIYLTVNKHNTLALHRYQQWGFVSLGGVVTDIGQGYVMDDWRMERSLP
jgi:diamine N-acetyltransferase